MPRARVQFSFGFALAVAGAVVGCAGYRLGPTNGDAAGQRSVQVNSFRNDTEQPRLTEEVNSALRRALQQDGTFRLATQGDGDIVISGVLVRYERPPLSFQPKDTLTVRDYRITVAAQIKATERITGKVLFDREVKGSTVVRLLPDQTSTERQALPLVADELARKAKGLLADGSF